MRRMNRTIVAALLVISLLLAPMALATDGADESWSLVEWAQDVLGDLFGGDAPEEDDTGVPSLGPHADPAG